MQVEQQVRACVLLISTRKYSQFVEPLIKQIEENFLPEHKRYIMLFTDAPNPDIKSRNGVGIIQVEIPSYKYPEVTLFRYRFFNHEKRILKYMDYLFYMDVDVSIPGKIGNEILNPLTVVHHSGFFRNGGWGSPNVSTESTAYFDEQFRKEYVAGGFNGGTAEEFLNMSEILARNTDEDEKNNVRAEWFDESHLNFFTSVLADRNKVKVLSPSYCLVEQKKLREAWGISELEPKIIALSKDHASIRS